LRLLYATQRDSQALLMTAEQYKAIRERIGTQEEIAKKLGLNRVTIARRETGTLPITREAELAITALKKRRRKENQPHE
jgi:DNA-binding XRE family transcriptional regulator